MARVDLRIVDKIAWLLTKPKRIKIIVGGRGSAKSIGVSGIMLGNADKGERICCAREFQNSIDDSVHENLTTEISRLGAEGFNVQNNRILSANKGEIFYKGLARNITSLKSLAGVSKLWIEEGEAVSEKTLKVLTPSIRSTASSNEDDEEPPEIWITMNRGTKNGAIAKKYLARAEAQLEKRGFYEDDLIMVVEVNWRDNPWFPPELEQERSDDYNNLPRAEYDHIWEGKYYDQVENSIILPEWFDAAIDAHLKKGFEALGGRIAAHDPSDTGSDAKGFAIRHGSVFTNISEINNMDINDGCTAATKMAIDEKCDAFIWDYGNGAALKQQISRAFNGKGIHFEAFNGADGVDFPEQHYLRFETDNKDNSRTNKQTFKNKRAQYYFMLRDRFYNTYRAIEKHEYIAPETMISISSAIPHIDLIRSEVCTVPEVLNDNGIKQILSKPKMKKLGIASPNMADSMMMAMVSPLAKTKRTAVKNVPAVNHYNQ